VQLLKQNYDELWAYVDEVLKYVPTVSYPNYFANIFKARKSFQIKSLSLKMSPPIFHAAFTLQLCLLIDKKIKDLQLPPDAATKELLADVETHLDAQISLENDTQLSPDLELRVDGEEFPGVVVEVAFSQPKKDLAKKPSTILLTQTVKSAL
jgi:hypothetical protein